LTTQYPFAAMPVRDHPERPGTGCRVVGALHCGDLADGKLEADAAAGGITSAAKPAPHVTAKMARCKVRATFMAVSPLVVAQARPMPGA